MKKLEKINEKSQGGLFVEFLEFDELNNIK